MKYTHYTFRLVLDRYHIGIGLTFTREFIATPGNICLHMGPLKWKFQWETKYRKVAARPIQATDYSIHYGKEND
jgi:hypothetical protein